MSNYMIEFTDEVEKPFQHVEAEYFYAEGEHFIFVNPYKTDKPYRIKKYLISNIWVKNYDNNR